MRWAKERRNASTFSGSPPRLIASAGKCSSASAYATSGTKNDTWPAYVSITLRTRFPKAARMRILASTTSALPGIPLLLAGSSADLLVLLHQLFLAGAPGRDHFVQVFRGSAHGFQLGLPASLLCRDIKAECLAVPHDRQWRSGFEVAREIFAEFAHANFNGFHIAYSLYTS